jgi:hypothetical protein
VLHMIYGREYDKLRELIAAAILAENEACAKVAESTAAMKPQSATRAGARPVRIASLGRLEIAAAIRRRHGA